MEPPSSTHRGASLPWIVHGAALGVFLLVVCDLAQGFGLLGTAAALVLLALAGLGGALVLRARLRGRTRRTTFAACLFWGAALTLAIRAIGYDAAAARFDETWSPVEHEETWEMARAASDRFAFVCAEALETAGELSRASVLSLATERPERTDRRAAAFRELTAAGLPRAHEQGVPGASLFDATLRPIAWSGKNAPRNAILEAHTRPLVTRAQILRDGAETYLVAIEPLANGRGLVTVEVPLAAAPRIENRYLDRYDALSAWAGRTVALAIPATEERALALARELESDGDLHWVDDGVAGRLRFALRCGDGELLGAGSLSAEVPRTARLEARRRSATAASAAAVATALAALLVLLCARPGAVAIVAGLGLFRLVLASSELSLGLGLELDNPAHYASSLFFGLARSPVDFLLTALTFLAMSAAIYSRGGRLGRSAPPLVGSVLASSATLLLFVGVQVVVFDTWLNSSLALSRVTLVPLDAPRLAVQLAFIALVVAASVTGFTLLSSAETGDASPRNVARALLVDASILGLGGLLAPGSFEIHVLLSGPPLLAFHALALSSWRGLAPAASEPGRRPLGVMLVFTLVSVASFFPALALFEDRTIQTFIETTVAPVVLQHERALVPVAAETARSIDRMLVEEPLDLESEDVAYRIWVGTDLAVSSLSSAVEVFDSSGELVSRFALGGPSVEGVRQRAPAPTEWIVEEYRLPGEPRYSSSLVARRSVAEKGEPLCEIQFQLAADWRNLPFIASSNPYLTLFRSAGSEGPLRFPYQELELFVLDYRGNPVFQSRDESLRLDTALLRSATNAPLWWEHPHELQTHRTYLFGDDHHIYALSYPEKRLLTRAAELGSWLLLGLGAVGLAIGATLLLGAAGFPAGPTPRELTDSLGRSFYGKLFIAFVLIALVPIALLAFLIRGVVVQQFQLEVEQEGLARARLVDRLIASDAPEANGEGERRLTLSDESLERIGNLAEVDVDVFRDGELLATSKPELFESGLLHTRAAPAAYRSVVLERLSHSFHRESVGSFDYLVVSVPLVTPSWEEIGIVSVPLASRQAELERRVDSLSQTVLLAALGFSLAAALLAYSLARRISDPINTLTEATHRVAGGDLEVSVATHQRDEIGELFTSFTQMIEDLKQQRDDLERTKKLEAWAEMARQVAHEVKNPLTPIQLATEHLLRVHRDGDPDFDKVLAECASTILDQVRTLRQISMEFSTFASPEPPKLKLVDLAALLRETMTPYVRTPPDGVRLSLEVGSELPPVEADARLIKRTLVNLVENALHAVGGEGRVSVSASAVEDSGRRFAEILVTDTGAGIDPELQARVFEPYFSTKAAGTGLGLAIAKTVVEDHGGTIALESEPGRGTRVTLRLPAASSPLDEG